MGLQADAVSHGQTGLLSPIRVQRHLPSLCLESQVRFCIMPHDMTGFYNPPAQYAAGRGDNERHGEEDVTETDELV